VFVSHDLPLVARVADDVRVLYEGRLVEYGPPARVLAEPRHRYTALLVNSLPSRERRGALLPEIPIPRGDAHASPTACPFLPRCPAAVAACGEMPPWDPTMTYRCHHPMPRETT
ncbi:MAG: oligopeptide/dipeptide ABC transporter ATP-binding protein, partial [Alkalispirochaeta sp.]